MEYMNGTCLLLSDWPLVSARANRCVAGANGITSYRFGLTHRDTLD
jgi:hypothetical protein